MDKKHIEEYLESKYGLWMNRTQIERDFLHMRTGRFPIEKLVVFDVDPSGKRKRYSTSSVASVVWAMQKPVKLFDEERAKWKDREL